MRHNILIALFIAGSLAPLSGIQAQTALASTAALPETIPAGAMVNGVYLDMGVDSLNAPWWLTEPIGKVLTPGSTWPEGAIKQYEMMVGYHNEVVTKLLPAISTAWNEHYRKTIGKKVRPSVPDTENYIKRIIESQGADEFEKRRSFDEQRAALAEVGFKKDQPLLCVARMNLQNYDSAHKGYFPKCTFPGIMTPGKPPAPACGVSLQYTQSTQVARVLIKSGEKIFSRGFFLPVDEATAESWTKTHKSNVPPSYFFVGRIKLTGMLGTSEPKVESLVGTMSEGAIYLQLGDSCKKLVNLPALKAAPDDIVGKYSHAKEYQPSVYELSVTLP